MNRTIVYGALGALATAAISISGAQAEPQYGPGASDTEIKIGNTNPYSGPASAYGAIGQAITAYFDMVNANGGVNGRKINFITLDDGYSPPKTVEQVRKLVEQEEVLLLFQTLGTPTNTAIHRYVNGKKVPHVFVATGASKWGQPEKYPWSMGWQPTYPIESRIYAKYIMDNVEDPKIGILFQNDDYGKDYLEGFHAGLGDAKDDLIVAEFPYEVTDPTIDSQIVELKNSGANVFFNITTPKFAAQAIRKVHDIGWKPMHFLNNVSTSVASVLTPAGLDKAVGIISSAYFKDPTDPQWTDMPDVVEWSAWMDQYHPRGNKDEAFNAYAYAVAFAMTEVLKMCGDNLTRENVMRQAASLQGLEVPMLLPGITVTTGADDFYPIEQMRLMRFNGEIWDLEGDVISAR
jgi:ABC-type branched-subunit amino acid transport system substrate-binding protein